MSTGVAYQRRSLLAVGAPRRVTAVSGGVLALLAVVAFLMAAPLIGLLIASTTDTPPGVAPHFTLASIADAYGDTQHIRSLLNSIVLSAITATLALVFGGALAWTAARTDSMVRHFVDLFALAPVLIPSVVFVAGWILLLGPKNGLLNLLAMQQFGMSEPPFNIYSFAGMIWVSTLQELPLAFLWLWPTFRAMNPDLEEAALVAGASPAVVMRRISLPLLWPALMSAWIIFFIYSVGALMVALMIGLPSHIILYSTEIYLAAQRVPADLNVAAAYSLLILGASLFAISAYRRSVRDASRFAVVTGKSFKPRIIKLGRWALPVTAFALVVLFLAAGLPILVLVWSAFMPFPQAPSARSFEVMTLANFRAALAYGPALSALVNSLWLGFAAGVVATVLGALIAWSTVRLKRPRWALAAIDQLATLSIAMPGMIIGVSLLSFYLMVPAPIYGTPWLLLIAYVTLHLPYAVRICASGILQLDHELEEAGRVAGANWIVVFRRIVLQLVFPSLLASVLYVALRSFREYAASIFLSSPGAPVFSVTVLDMWDTGNFSLLSAYVTMVVLLLAVVVTVFGMLARRLGAQQARAS
jgi:iron(III) transport system permease protein